MLKTVQRCETMIKNNKKITVYFLLIIATAIPAYAAGTWNNTGAYYETNNTILTTLNQSYIDSYNLSFTANNTGLSYYPDNSTGQTWMFRFKLNADAINSATSQEMIKHGYFYAYVRNQSGCANQVLFRYSDGIAAREVFKCLEVGDRNWHTVFYKYASTIDDKNRQAISVFMDGAPPLNSNNIPASHTYVTVKPQSVNYNGTVIGNTNSNFSIDYLRMWNRTLTNKEIYNLSYPNNVTVATLMYHIIVNDSTDNLDLETNASKFRQELAYLQSQGYTSITDREWINYTSNQGFQIPSKPVIFTFDDGHGSVYDYAAPIMAEYGFKGVAAINGVSITGGTQLSWSEVAQLVSTYNWSIASHGYTHCHFGSDPGGTSPTWCNNTANRTSNWTLNIQVARDNLTLYNLTNYTMLTHIFPYNDFGVNPTEQNTIAEECKNYFSMCYGAAYQQINPRFNFATDNLTNSTMNRIDMYNDTTVKTLSYALGDIEYGSTGIEYARYMMDEASGNTLYDSIGGRNLNLTTSTRWRNDSTNRTLTREVDYTTTPYSNGSTNISFLSGSLSYQQMFYYPISYSSDLVVTSNSSQIVFNNTNSSTKYSLSIYNFSNVTVYSNNVWNRAYNSLITQADMDINASYNLLFLQGYYDNPDVTVSICNNGLEGLNELGGWLPVIALIIGAAAVVGVLGFGKGIDSLNLESLGSAAITIVFTVIVIAVGATIISGAIC